jgi:hypothetical protein
MPSLHVVLDVAGHQHAAAAQWWQQVLGWPLGRPWPTHPELSSFEPPRGTAYVQLQRVDGPSAVHLDLEAEAPDVAISRALDLGASPVAQHDRWHTFTSPGGLPFCVLRTPRRDGREAVDPVEWPGGHRTRLVQVCIDAPAAVHEREVRFWRQLLDGRWVDSEAAEFAGKWYDDTGGPLQLLFQRLEEDAGPVRAHLDLGADDVPAEVNRLLMLGAEDLGAGPGWHVLRDPLGRVFCATANPP